MNTSYYSQRWKVVLLGSVASFKNGVNYSKADFGKGLKIINVKDFEDYVLANFNDLDEINLRDSISSEHLLKNGDILLVRSNGNRELIGRSLYVTKIKDEVTYSGFTIRARIISAQALPRFYAYLLRWSMIRQTFSAYGGGTNISNLNQQILSSLSVPLPPMDEQTKIAAILSSYDDLIDNNLRRIKIMEEMAQNLYSEWFVKFRFPGHEKVKMVDSNQGKIPQGWKVAGIFQVPYFNFIHKNIEPYEGEKTYYATADVNGIEVTGNGIEYTYAGKPSRAQKQPILNSVWFARMQNTCKLLFFTDTNKEFAHKSMISSGFAGFKSNDKLTLPFLLFTIDSTGFHTLKDKYCTGATQRSLTNEGLGHLEVVIPPLNLVSYFGRVVCSSIDEILILQHMNRTIRATLSLLLPRLISGELDVSDLDIKTGNDE